VHRRRTQKVLQISTANRSSPCLALVAALPGEGDRLLAQLGVTQSVSLGNLQIHRSERAGKEALVAFSGLGKVNAAATVASILTRFPVSRLWMWGSGGAYPQSGAEPGGLALASEEILGEEGVATLSSWQPLDAIGIPVAETSTGPIFNRIPVDQSALAQARALLDHRQAARLAPTLHVGSFVTVSAASGSPARARLFRERFGALCENMEGGAAAQVCLNHGVPFLEIRGLSNWAGDRCKPRWRLREALDACQRALLHLLTHWEEE
jgi:futalosine hydrolase